MGLGLFTESLKTLAKQLSMVSMVEDRTAQQLGGQIIIECDSTLLNSSLPSCPILSCAHAGKINIGSLKVLGLL